MNNLGFYYEGIGEYNNAKKYYRMGVLNQDKKSFLDLIKLYTNWAQNIKYNENNTIDEIIKTTDSFGLIQEDIILIESLREKNEELRKENEMMREHIKYAPGGEGMLEALSNFNNLQKRIEHI
jgi:hypothetical protein